MSTRRHRGRDGRQLHSLSRVKKHERSGADPVYPAVRRELTAARRDEDHVNEIISADPDGFREYVSFSLRRVLQYLWVPLDTQYLADWHFVEIYR